MSMISSDMDSLTAIIRELESERNAALNNNKALQSELYRLTQESVQNKRYWDSAKDEVVDLKQTLQHYYSEVQHLQDMNQKKDEDRIELIGHIRFMNQEKTEMESVNEKLNRDVRTGREHLAEAEKEILRLQRAIQDKDYGVKLMEDKIQEMSHVMGELESAHVRTQQDKHLLAEQLAQCKNSLQMSLMHEESLRHQLASLENCKLTVDNELEERKLVIVSLHEELSREKGNVDNLEKALRQIRSDMNAACIGHQKKEEEITCLHERIRDLTGKLNQRQDEQEAIRRNVEDIRQEVISIKRNENTNNTIRTYETSCGDQTPPHPRNYRIDQQATDNVHNGGMGSKTETKFVRDYMALRCKYLTPFVKKSNSFFGSIRPKESDQRGVDHISDIVSTSPVLNKYTASKFYAARRQSKYERKM
uniref:Uncharacterized protein n=1 Tax=Cacopsylla melanoneura TaxID=428564 RepID=A0A8D8X6S2_9HEMI